jgi:hypothetical protein
MLKFRILLCRLFSKPLCIIKIENGVVTKVAGSVKNSFIADCIEIVKLNDLQHAFIYTVHGKFGKPVLKASREIPDGMLQQLRNAWGINS